MTYTIVSGENVLVGEQWLTQHALIMCDGKIEKIIPQHAIVRHLPAEQLTLKDAYYIVPGLIDVHIHGALGCDVMDGKLAALQTISHALAQEGVSSFLATTMTAHLAQLEHVLQIAAIAKEQALGMIGVHLEGPFIAKDKAGAQCAAHCLAPNMALLKRWQQQFNNVIKLVTLAPELPQANDMITRLSELNIIPSLGHTNATYTETCAAIAAGAKHATHLFNAMRGIHQREPGATGALLLAEHVKTEIIVDGLHLHPAIVKLILQMKSAKNIVLVTDAMRAKCLGDGHYELGSQAVTVERGRATLADGTLAGSTLTMPQAIKNMVRFTGCALSTAIYMASRNPAQALGIADRKGELAVGKDADLAVLDKALNVVATLREGNVIFSAERFS